MDIRAMVMSVTMLMNALLILTIAMSTLRVLMQFPDSFVPATQGILVTVRFATTWTSALPGKITVM